MKTKPIIVVSYGLQGSGKTALLNVMVDNKKDEPVSTIGVDRKMFDKDRYLIWDAGGGDSFKSIVVTYSRNIDVYLLTVDGTRPDESITYLESLINGQACHINPNARFIINFSKSDHKDFTFKNVRDRAPVVGKVKSILQGKLGDQYQEDHVSVIVTSRELEGEDKTLSGELDRVCGPIFSVEEGQFNEDSEERLSNKDKGDFYLATRMSDSAQKELPKTKPSLLRRFLVTAGITLLVSVVIGLIVGGLVFALPAIVAVAAVAVGAVLGFVGIATAFTGLALAGVAAGLAALGVFAVATLITTVVKGVQSLFGRQESVGKEPVEMEFDDMSVKQGGHDNLYASSSLKEPDVVKGQDPDVDSSPVLEQNVKRTEDDGVSKGQVETKTSGAPTHGDSNSDEKLRCLSK